MRKAASFGSSELGLAAFFVFKIRARFKNHRKYQPGDERAAQRPPRGVALTWSRNRQKRRFFMELLVTIVLIILTLWTLYEVFVDKIWKDKENGGLK